MKHFFFLLHFLLITCVSYSQYWKTYNVSNSGVAGNSITSLAIDRYNNVWIGTADSGVSKFDGSTWTKYIPWADSGQNCHVSAITVDTLNNIWLATSGTGLGAIKFDGTSWTYYQVNLHFNGLPSNDVFCITHDVTDAIWVGTNNGAAKFVGSGWLQYEPSDSGLSGSTVSNIIADSANNILFASWGLAVLHDTTWHNYNTANCGLTNNAVEDMAIDLRGNLWIVSGSHIIQYSAGIWTDYFPTQYAGGESPPGKIIAVDRQNNKWFASDGGVQMYNDSFWTVYNASNSGLAENYVSAVAIDSEGNKWFGTADNGVSVLMSSGTGIENVMNNNGSLLIYPNPSGTYIRIAATGYGDLASQIEIFDILGQKVYNAYTTSTEIDVSNLAPGIYLLRLTAAGVSETAKFVKQ